MSQVVVFLAKALICFSGQCFPALVGPDTPTGDFQMHQLYTEQPGYGGDVLVFKEDSEQWFAVHRTYTLDRARKRSELYGQDSRVRHITKGCINVEPAVYEMLKNEKYTEIEIKP